MGVIQYGSIISYALLGGGVLGDNVLCQSFYKTELTEIFNFHLLSKNLVINVGRSLSTPYYIYDKERPGKFMYLLL